MQLLLLPEGFSCIELLSAPWDAWHIQHLNSSDLELCTSLEEGHSSCKKQRQQQWWVAGSESFFPLLLVLPSIRELSLGVYWAAVWFVISVLICLCNSAHHLISVLVCHSLHANLSFLPTDAFIFSTALLLTAPYTFLPSESINWIVLLPLPFLLLQRIDSWWGLGWRSCN